MESLTLDDGQTYQRYQDRLRLKDRKRRSPRLPTPETSRSGDDSQSPPDSSHPVRNIMMGSAGVGHMRHDSRNSAGQPSPPCRAMDMQKPSLPPLKTVSPTHLPHHLRTNSPFTGSWSQHHEPTEDSEPEWNLTAAVTQGTALYSHDIQTAFIVSEQKAKNGSCTIILSLCSFFNTGTTAPPCIDEAERSLSPNFADA